MSDQRRMIKVASLPERYVALDKEGNRKGCAMKTVERMLKDPTFPEVFRLREGGHRYVYEDELERWERSRVVRRVA